MEQYLLHFGRQLRQLRNREDMTQAELARRLGVQQPYIARLEGAKEEKQPALTFVLAVSQLFNVGIDELLGIKLAEEPPLLNGLRAEDRAMVIALITRLRRDNEDTLDEDWELLNTAALDLERGGSVGRLAPVR